ncbi:MAG: cobalt-precorrin-5B (C(1))-methyltransferase CbiD [Treponema sp.]|nr:cobalt-precorrin-5B (C(1))-methyltransferase CbiD [Treponema sp.]
MLADDIPANEHYILSGTRRLRCGFTTGTCAALASQAAAYTALTGHTPKKVTVRTPKGWLVHAEPVPESAPTASSKSAPPLAARCGIQKDAGDDPDITDGCIVYATVKLFPALKSSGPLTVRIDGGEGVGRVTKPGLDQAPGNAAINSVPRSMITQAVQRVLEDFSFSGSAEVIIDVPEGKALAERTFNPMLGITGGISILGTSGVVEPMSEAALIETIDAELRIRAAESPEGSCKPLIITPGNYGEAFIAQEGSNHGSDADGLEKALRILQKIPTVKCSNFIGEAIDRACVYGFTHLLLIGHAGKFVKLAGGIMNTHSHTADCRMEIITAHAALSGAERTTLTAIMDAATVDAALEILDAASEKARNCSARASDSGAAGACATGSTAPCPAESVSATERAAAGATASAVMERIIKAAEAHISRRALPDVKTGCIMFTNVRGLLGMSDETKTILTYLKNNIRP